MKNIKDDNLVIWQIKYIHKLFRCVRWISIQVNYANLLVKIQINEKMRRGIKRSELYCWIILNITIRLTSFENSNSAIIMLQYTIWQIALSYNKSKIVLQQEALKRAREQRSLENLLQLHGLIMPCPKLDPPHTKRH